MLYFSSLDIFRVSSLFLMFLKFPSDIYSLGPLREVFINALLNQENQMENNFLFPMHVSMCVYACVHVGGGWAVCLAVRGRDRS